MSETISASTNVFDYEILIRKRGDGEYASYCPQLNLMLTGTEHEQVQTMMQEAVLKHVDELKAKAN